MLKSVRSYLVLKRLGMLGSVVSTEPDRPSLEDERFGTTFDVLVRTLLAPTDVAAAVLSVAEVAGVETTAAAGGPAPAAPASERPTAAHDRAPETKPRTV